MSDYGLEDGDFRRLTTLKDRLALVGGALCFGCGPLFIAYLRWAYGEQGNGPTGSLLGAAVVGLVFPGLLLFVLFGNSLPNAVLPRLQLFKSCARYCAAVMAFRHRLEEFWIALSWRDFEREVASHLRTLGLDAVPTPASGDKGIDILLNGPHGRGGVQCKKHAKPIGPGPVRELIGAVAGAGLKFGAMVSLSGYTSGAVDTAGAAGIRLLSLDDLIGPTECLREKLT